MYNSYPRYARHLALPDFSPTAQQKLAKARVLVVGAGGLGAPALLYLTAAGIGTIGIADPDRVSLSNLQRQVLFSEADVGQSKSRAAARELRKRNTEIHIREHPVCIDRNNGPEIISDYDLVLDATDNFPARYLLNDLCVLQSKTYIYGSIYQYEGQVSVFNAQMETGERGPHYRDLFPAPPPPNQIPDCAEGGVLGSLAGIVGSVQANEVIKCVTGIGTSLAGRLWILDARDMLTRTVQLPSRSTHPVTELIDYAAFCGQSLPEPGREISPQTLRTWLQASKPLRLIDLRTPAERERDRLESEHIPLDELAEQVNDLLPTHIPIVFYCQSGKRSASTLTMVQEQFPEEECYHLKGGLNAWRQAGF